MLTDFRFEDLFNLLHTELSAILTTDNLLPAIATIWEKWLTSLVTSHGQHEFARQTP